MGKKLDALLGRSFKASKFKILVNLSISRLAVLKNQRQARFSVARSDVVQLLFHGHHERALLRVEQVIKEQNMLDVFVMIQGYCLLLCERVNLLEHDKECPDELKEAISSLIFAASRCGDCPELQQIRAIFTHRYGKEFSARAVELRNNCGVNPKMIQKLSTRQPSLESRMKVLKEIADQNGIALQIEETPSIASKETLNEGNEKRQSSSSDDSKVGQDLKNFPEETEELKGFSNSMNTTRKQYKDVADAAEEAFVSAAYAAAAARAAVELSRSNPRSPDNPNHPNNNHSSSEIKSIVETSDGNNPGEPLDQIDKYSLDSDDEETKEEIKSPEIVSIEQVDSRKNSSIIITSSQEVEFDESDDEAKGEKVNSISDENPWGDSGKYTPPSFQAADQKAHSSAVNTEKRPHSVRTKRSHWLKL